MHAVSIQHSIFAFKKIKIGRFLATRTSKSVSKQMSIRTNGLKKICRFAIPFYIEGRMVIFSLRLAFCLRLYAGLRLLDGIY